MIQRFAKTLFLVGAVLGVACIDMSAPKGAASISILQMGAPFVVVGDTLRDSTGTAVPLKVLAFDANNNSIDDIAAQFFLTDTTTAAHITPVHFVVGDKIGTVHLVGQVGNLQTPTTPLQVTYLPAAVLPVSGATIDTAFFDVAADSSASYGRSKILARIASPSDSNVAGVVVQYRVVYAPASRPGASPPAVFITDDNNKFMPLDTTETNGQVSRTVSVFPRSITDADLLKGLKVDSAVIEVSASYKGKALAGSPLRLTVPIKSK